jgi:hypothetical protein
MSKEKRLIYEDAPGHSFVHVGRFSRVLLHYFSTSPGKKSCRRSFSFRFTRTHDEGRG